MTCSAFANTVVKISIWTSSSLSTKDKCFLADRTSRSQTPPLCGDVGGLKAHSTPCICNSCDDAAFHCSISCRISFSAAVKFDPQSLKSFFTPGLRDRKRTKAFMKDDDDISRKTSKCTALTAMQVNRHTQTLWYARPAILTRNGPKTSTPVASKGAPTAVRSGGNGAICWVSGALNCFWHGMQDERTFWTVHRPFVIHTVRRDSPRTWSTPAWSEASCKWRMKSNTSR